MVYRLISPYYRLNLVVPSRDLDAVQRIMMGPLYPIAFISKYASWNSNIVNASAMFLYEQALG